MSFLMNHYQLLGEKTIQISRKAVIVVFVGLELQGNWIGFYHFIRIHGLQPTEMESGFTYLQLGLHWNHLVDSWDCYRDLPIRVYQMAAFDFALDV